jgi:hypothetical protein
VQASAQYQVDQVELQNPSQLMPCNALPALKSALDQHDGCIVVCADGEADSLIAQISCQFQCTAVMAQDSDFFFARLSMPESLPATIYIPFDTLRFVENASTITVRAQSWTRDRIAAFLNLSCQTSTPTATFDDDTQVAHALLSHLFRAKVMPEYQLLACLVGNDWTLPAQWLGEFHQRLSTHGLSDISVRFHFAFLHARIALKFMYGNRPIFAETHVPLSLMRTASFAACTRGCTHYARPATSSPCTKPVIFSISPARTRLLTRRGLIISLVSCLQRQFAQFIIWSTHVSCPVPTTRRRASSSGAAIRRCGY